MISRNQLVKHIKGSPNIDKPQKEHKQRGRPHFVKQPTDPKARGRPTIAKPPKAPQRRGKKPNPKLEAVALCVDNKKAMSASLVKYKEEVEICQEYKALQVFFKSLPSNVTE